MANQVEVARKVGVDVSTVNKILNRKPGPVFRRETINQVFRAAKALGYDFGRLKFHHKRRHARKTIGLSAELVVYRSDGTVHDKGTATIRDVSPSGARLTNVVVPSRTFPAEAFIIGIRSPNLLATEVKAHVVRLLADDCVSLGVRFIEQHANFERALRRGPPCGNNNSFERRSLDR